MNVSYLWLRALAPGLKDSPQQVAERLTMYGAPVDELVALGEPLADIVIARVEQVQRHPNADRLTLCQVNAGRGELLNVVCGAPNVRSGGFYPFAPVGASLPGGVSIRKTKIRGEASEGMLCSERELGLGRDQEGILELRGHFTPGEPFAPALGLDDYRIVVDVTPNRPDLLSHYGLARELAPQGDSALRLPAFPRVGGNGSGLVLAELRFERAAREAHTGGIRVLLEDDVGCPRYIGAVLRGATVGPSPDWLAARLRAVGLRPINNVVDATNYVLYGLGQPLHAFDLDRLGGGEVRIRKAQHGESMVSLDGERRTLAEDMVVIADAQRAIAIAGVMGGQDSEVSAETHNIFLECALFDPKSIRRTRRALGMSTDASYRFERGVDADSMERATRRALALMQAVAGGTVEPLAADLYPAPRAPRTIVLRPTRVERVLGKRFTTKQLGALLHPLGFTTKTGEGRTVVVTVPGHRWYDVEREVDLIEEVARRHGFDKFSDDVGPARPSAVPDDALAALENRLREQLVGRGFLEARMAAFAPEGEGDVVLLNPLSSAEDRLRRALVPGLVHAIERNFARGTAHVRLFEIGTIFLPPTTAGGVPIEATRLAAVCTGARTPPQWSEPSQSFDVWDLKGLLEELALALGAAVEPGEAPGAPFAPGAGLHVVANGAMLGYGGEIDPLAIDAPQWASPVWALELELARYSETRDATVQLTGSAGSAFAAQPLVLRPLPAFPAIERDIALLAPEELPSADIERVIRAAAGPLLEEVTPFDVYRGRELPAGRRSVAFRLRFRATDRTLTDPEADQATERTLRRLREELGVERRG